MRSMTSRVAESRPEPVIPVGGGMGTRVSNSITVDGRVVTENELGSKFNDVFPGQRVAQRTLTLYIRATEVHVDERISRATSASVVG